MNPDEQQRIEAMQAGMAAFDALTPLLDTLDGMVATVRQRGFTEAEARAIVTTVFRQSAMSG